MQNYRLWIAKFRDLSVHYFNFITKKTKVKADNEIWPIHLVNFLMRLK